MTLADTESFLYFAYGSNASSRRLLAYDRVPAAQVAGRGSVSGRKLVFDKYSRKDGSGKADCEYTGIEAGVLFEIPVSMRKVLDYAEGAGSGYERGSVEVLTDTATVSATTYFATTKRPALKPFTWYLHHVLVGAREHGFPQPYIAQIEATSAIFDPDTERHVRELSIYP